MGRASPSSRLIIDALEGEGSMRRNSANQSLYARKMADMSCMSATEVKVKDAEVSAAGDKQRRYCVLYQTLIRCTSLLRHAAQFGKDGLAVRADVDIGIGRIESDGLVGIEDKRPRTCSMFDEIEHAGPLQRCQAGLGVKGGRGAAVARPGGGRG